jgi:CheY-like chemotaxis protein
MRILIAEDEKVTRMRLEKTLSEWGFDVEAVADGQSAFERLCGEDPPRLCIIDWLMPRMEGPELCRRVREKFPEDYFYLIILSAQQGVDNLIEGLSAGCSGWSRCWPKKSGSWKLHWRMSSSCADCFRFVRIATRSATMKITGSRWTVISAGIPM